MPCRGMPQGIPVSIITAKIRSTESTSKDKINGFLQTKSRREGRLQWVAYLWRQLKFVAVASKTIYAVKLCMNLARSNDYKMATI